MFDPQSLINRLGKMDHMEDKEGVQPKKQADAFRTWLSARKHFGAGAAVEGGAAGSSRRYSMPVAVVEAPKVQGSRETERVREVLGKAVASQHKTEQLQEEGTCTCTCTFT